MARGIFTPHFKRSEIVAGPPADLPAEVSTQAGPSQFRSDIFKQAPPPFTSAKDVRRSTWRFYGRFAQIDMESEKFLIINNTKNGKGVFANKNFQKGETIFEFHGKFFTYEELPIPYNGVENHFVQIGKNLYMGPSGDIDDFFNHSCDPNTGLKINDKNVFLVAIRDMAKGAEITFDYSTTMDEDDWEMDCKCDSKNCRGRIRDFKHLPPNIQKQYLNFGIVPKYISKNFQKEFAAQEQKQL